MKCNNNASQHSSAEGEKVVTMLRTTKVLFFAACLLLAIALAQSAAPAFAQAAPPSHRHSFDDPQRWSAVFDDPARAAWQKPDEVIRALALKPADRIADIGAGTGYFAVRLARAAPQGIVFAADIEPKMVAHLADRAKKEGLANVRAVQAKAASPELPEPVDLALVVDTYHHIDTRADYFRRLKGSLKPGGRVAIIDFKRNAPEGPPKRLRVSARQIAAEMKAAGYKLARSHAFLPRQNFLEFAPE